MGVSRTFKVNVSPSAVVQVTVVGQQFNTASALKESLGFVARTVQVDNFTEAWIYFPENNLFIPPFTVGAFRPLYNNSTYAYFDWANPLGQLTAFASLFEFVAVTYFEDALPFQVGSTVDIDLGVPTTIIGFVGNVPASAFDGGMVTVNNTADPIGSPLAGSERRAISVYNQSATVSAFIGPSGVAASGATQGIELRPKTGFTLPLSENAQLYGITAASTADISYLQLYQYEAPVG